MAKRKEVIMQTICIYCKQEQYAISVYPVSHGEMGCAKCGKIPPVFNNLKKYKEELEKPIKK
jgi:hypothetical protein